MVRGLNEPGYGPGDDEEPTEAEDTQAFRKGMDYVTGPGVRNPKNDGRTNSVLRKMDEIVDRGKARRAAQDNARKGGKGKR